MRQLFVRFICTVSAYAFVLCGQVAIAGDLEVAEAARDRKDYAKALALFRKAAADGDAVAQFKLGGMVARGEGIKADVAEAVGLLTQSAKQGYAPAQNSLGVRYEKGVGVERDLVRAATLYQQASEQRYGLAQGNLADCYAQGLGVTRDMVLAHVWSNLATVNGEVRAARKRLAMERAFTPSQRSEADTSLGIMFSRGRGVEKDAMRAAALFQKAAERGYPLAQFELAESYDKGSGFGQD